MSTPPNASTTWSNAARTEAASVTSHWTGNACSPIALACSDRGLGVDVEQRDLGARRGERLGGRRADGAAGAGDDGDLAGQRQALRGAELGALQRPVFAIEHVGFADRLESCRSLRRR